MKITEISYIILKHFNHDINTAKILNAIRDAILKGKESDLRYAEERIKDLENLENQWEFLNCFWEKHKQEFYDAGFNDVSYLDHPLFGAYNNISCQKHYLEQGVYKNPAEITSHKFADYDATGPFSYDEISEITMLSCKDIKFSINKLESLNIIGKGRKDLGRAYWYYLMDNTYLN